MVITIIMGPHAGGLLRLEVNSHRDQEYKSPPAIKPVGFLVLVRPAGRTHLEVKVLYIPGKGKC